MTLTPSKNFMYCDFLLIMKVKQGSKVKCRNYPKPVEENDYIYINKTIDDIHIGEMFYFQCHRGFWRPEDNSTEPFGFPCTAGNYTVTMEGEYNETSIDQPCVTDENYVAGCKVQDRQNPDGEGRKSGLMIDPTNPDNVLIGDYLRYICPDNPKVIGTRQVVHNDTDFYVKCVVDAQFQKLGRLEWPKCREPLTCIAADGPPVPQSVKTSGLRDSYTDTLEFQNLTFTCTESSKEPVGNKTVLRQFSSNPDDPMVRVFEVKFSKKYITRTKIII